jgi:hypothetical protein
MKARHLIDSASFGPEALKAIGQAFDAAWRDIAGDFGDDPRDIELARMRLATQCCRWPLVVCWRLADCRLRVALCLYVWR